MKIDSGKENVALKCALFQTKAIRINLRIDPRLRRRLIKLNILIIIWLAGEVTCKGQISR